jgi:hypothetical protein
MSARGVDTPLPVPSPVNSDLRPQLLRDAGEAQLALSNRVTDAELHAIAAEPSSYGAPTVSKLLAELRRLRGLILDFDADERAGGCALLDEAYAIREERGE